jgi:1-acyl-sn-glycerol-3-phosphate acyltransferase
VLKTSSGKVRRSACRELYEQGRLAERQRALWSQALRLAASGVSQRVRAVNRAVGETAYATWWWCALVMLAVVVWPLSLAAPSRSRAWALLHAGARAFLWFTRTPLSIAGPEGLEREAGAVLVANHASYLDGLVLAAVLRHPVRFVAKRELAEQRVAGAFLRRIGALFVERTDLERGIQDARIALDAASTGEPLLFFPEGTFRRGPGLLAFHVGAFTVAAAAGVPVIPVAVRGTRSILRGDQWFPRRGAISLEIGPSLEPKSSDWSSAIELRDAARVWLLAHCGEPDLEEDVSASG